MKKTIILFEPDTVRSLGPLVMTRPVWDLRVGPRRLRDWIVGKMTENLTYWARPELSTLCSRPSDECFESENVLLLAGHQLLTTDDVLEKIADLNAGQSLKEGDEILAICLSGADARDFLNGLRWDTEAPAPSERAVAGPLGPILHYWWEIFELADPILQAALPALTQGEAWRSVKRSDWPASESIHLADDVQLAPGVILDARDGPIVLDRGVVLGASAYLQGPCYLGPGTRIKPHAQLLHGCFAGPQCRLGGEIEWTQFQGLANKQHHGFLGHAVLGEWVNLGAGVTNSDLKNNYSPVTVHQGSEELDTSRLFVGACFGDHVKVAIQGRLNTGTVLEPFCNWFGAGFPPKYMPAFSWGGDEGVQTYQIEKALDTAAVVMARRGRELDDSHEALYRQLFEARQEG